MVEQRIFNPWVRGSSPLWSIIGGYVPYHSKYRTRQRPKKPNDIKEVFRYENGRINSTGFDR